MPGEFLQQFFRVIGKAGRTSAFLSYHIISSGFAKAPPIRSSEAPYKVKYRLNSLLASPGWSLWRTTWTGHSGVYWQQAELPTEMMRAEQWWSDDDTVNGTECSGNKQGQKTALTAEVESGLKELTRDPTWPVTRPDPVAIDPVTQWPDPTRFFVPKSVTLPSSCCFVNNAGIAKRTTHSSPHTRLTPLSIRSLKVSQVCVDLVFFELFSCCFKIHCPLQHFELRNKKSGWIGSFGHRVNCYQVGSGHGSILLTRYYLWAYRTHLPRRLIARPPGRRSLHGPKPRAPW